MRILAVCLITLSIQALAGAQTGDFAAIEPGKADSVAPIMLNEVRVLDKHFNNEEERKAFERLKRNTLKVYPYVEMAVQIYDEMQGNLENIERRRQQKKYINKTEKELRSEFEKEIRNLTRSQGEILIKLINRETGNNCYQIVKDMKGPMVAFFWNVAGKFYDHNLREEYKPGENEDLEFIVEMIKNQRLTP